MTTPGVRHFDEFIPRASQYLQGCPNSVIRQAYLDSAREFCDKTQVWRDFTPYETVTQGQPSLDFVPPNGAEISKILNVNFLSHMLTQFTNESFNASFPGYPEFFNQQQPGQPDPNTGQPIGYWSIQTNAIQLYPIPDKNYPNSIRAFCSFRPALDADGISMDIMDDYYEVVMYGALRRLYDMPNKPWSDQQGSVKNGKMFIYGCNRAKADINLGKTRGNIAVDTTRAGVGSTMGGRTAIRK